MLTVSRALAAGLALAAGAALACAAKANEGTTYYYSDDSTTLYAYPTEAQTYYYSDPALSDPVIVAPAPRVYYYSAPVYVTPGNTTYYYGPSNHEHYSLSARGYVYTTPPGYVTTPPGYVPPGLSITTPTGTYAPFYGGWNSYSNEYRTGR
jgi:hypothetical protein